ncbi:MAG: hypothetical protein Q8N44_18735 [Rubrivivax sp.]|nr:hypothetical protein [Rubrivivax sp.]MDP3085708.1 hypothetical protein [Rubrivivax sp.]
MPPEHLPHDPRPCRFCGATLNALERLRGDACDSLHCRGSAGHETALAQRDADLARQRASAARRWHNKAVLQAPVVWLEKHEVQLARVSAAQRQAQQAHVDAAATRCSEAGEATRPGAAPAEPTSDTPLAGALCAFCAGRCCRHGAASQAFVTTELLQRWLDRHPGRTPADAAAQYTGRLPAWHVKGSCLHHGRSGCTLPSELRSDICNRYACSALRQLEDRASAGADTPVLAAMQRIDTLGDVALLGPQGGRRLPRRRQGS